MRRSILLHFHHAHTPFNILQAKTMRCVRKKRIEEAKKKTSPTNTLNIYLFSFNEYFCLITPPKQRVSIDMWGMEQCTRKPFWQMNELKTNRWNDDDDEDEKKPPNKWIEYKLRLCVRIRAHVKCSKCVCVYANSVWVCQEKLDNCVFWMDKHLTNK